MGKISRNVMKVRVHACLSNRHPNLWSNFNCEKIVRSETSSCIFARVRLKAVPNSLKHCKIWCARLQDQIYDQISILGIWSKVKLCHAVSLGLGINVLKIVWNIMKVGMHACLLNMHPNLWWNFNSEKLVKSKTSLCDITVVGLNGVTIAWSVMKFTCTLVYQTDIQIYDQI